MRLFIAFALAALVLSLVGGITAQEDTTATEASPSPIESRLEELADDAAEIGEAIGDGADFIVMGRSLLRAEDPAKVAGVVLAGLE